MSVISPPSTVAPSEQDLARWRRLQEERSFRMEQLASLKAGSSSPHRDDSVRRALRIAAANALREIDAALTRMEEGRYGRCVTCSEQLPDERLDVLPMASLCMPCHYNEQNCRAAVAGT